MPKLNSRGDITGGVGGTTVNVNGQNIASPAGGAHWVDDNHVVYQVCDGVPEVCRVEMYDTRTGEKTVVLPHGAFDVYGNGGICAVRFDGVKIVNCAVSPPQLRHHFPASAAGGVGPDGATAVKVDYQSWGPWDVVERDGSRWRLTDNDAIQINLLGQGRAVWLDTAGLRSRNMPAPQLLPGALWWMRVVDVAGEWWVLYQHADGRLVFHPFTSTVGYMIAPPGSLTYRPDVVSMGGTRVRIAWASREDEGIDVQHTVDLDVTSRRLELAVAPVPEPPPPPPPPPEQPMYRSEADILPYMQQRWAELGIPESVKAVSNQFNIHTNREMTRLRENGTAAEKAKQKKAYAAFQEVQIPAFFRIVGEMYHVKGWRDVGLGKKTGGNQWDGKATDIIVLKPLNGSGQVQQYDALSSAGYPESKPMWSELPSFNPERTWVEPPSVGGTPDPEPDPEPDPDPDPAPDPDVPVSLEQLWQMFVAFRAMDQQNFALLDKRVRALEGPYSVTLRTAHGTYVKAEDVNHEINASATAPGPWETFTLDRPQE